MLTSFVSVFIYLFICWARLSIITPLSV